MGSPEDASSFGATVAGFIVWLAEGRRVETGERESCVTHAERFLDWCAQRRAEGVDLDENAYLGELSRADESDAYVAQARDTVALLRQYLGSDVPKGE